MKIKVNAKLDPDNYRGFGKVKKFVVRNWRHLNKTDLEYLLKSILYPQIIHANGKIILK